MAVHYRARPAENEQTYCFFFKPGQMLAVGIHHVQVSLRSVGLVVGRIRFVAAICSIRPGKNNRIITGQKGRIK